ncbi:MAG: ABC transporter permease [Alphaproteobacteria bacterium]|nr:ABC transporter permease [Alphaproteobacteria bacterium]
MARTEQATAAVGQTLGSDGTLTLSLSGDWRIAARPPSPDSVERALGGTPPPRRLAIVAPGLGHWDSALLAFVRHLEGAAAARGVPVDLKGLPDGVRRLLDLAGPAGPVGRPAAAPRRRLVTAIGSRTLSGSAATIETVRLVGELAIGLGRWLRAAADLRGVDLLAQIQHCGAEALPIVIVIAFLVGMILAYVGAIQLGKFGADIFVADLVTIAMLREMAAIMTGIVLAGRTGAAFAAELGAMQGNEEVDALTTIGIRPVEFLVLPRVAALALMTPLLCLYADVAGIFGGVVVAGVSLHTTIEAFFGEIQYAASVTNLVIGLVKGTVFGVLVGFTGCRRGLAAARSAAGVGHATTSAVVSGILQIIVADAIFAVALNILGL